MKLGGDGGNATPLRAAQRTAGDTISGVVIPLQDGRPTYPTAGTIIRSMQATVTLAGASPSTSSPYPVVDTPEAERVDIVILHVLEEHMLPAFSDQPQYEWETFGREFLARYSPWPIERVRLETRVGHPEQYILPVARETKCDLIALAWEQEPDFARMSPEMTRPYNFNP